MDNKKNELQIELSPEVASGHYANIAAIAHTPGEFFIDFIALTPNVPKAKVQSRIIMNPENAKTLLFALRDNIQKYENMFGPIERKMPVNNQGNNSQGGNGEIPNPFMA
ncbi:MAG: DUF3467 domain-containing protein [Muribaculaceae bacterium]|nr:DUF3467 domain-containing protein [Muribaculaceae bacterium]